jgi:hypothetical protein
MTDPTTDREASHDAGTHSRATATVGMPRWVKISLIVAGVLIAVLVALKFAHVGPQHGPERHFGPGMHRPTPSSMESE